MKSDAASGSLDTTLLVVLNHWSSVISPKQKDYEHPVSCVPSMDQLRKTQYARHSFSYAFKRENSAMGPANLILSCGQQ
jgi:hypothetical protein